MNAKCLSEIMTSGVIGVSQEAPVSSTLKLLRNKNISCVLVLKDRVPVGILTERKVVQLLAEQGPQLDKYAVRNIMTSPVLTAGREVDIYSAYDLLITHKIRHIVVVDDDNKLCGVVTQSNIMDHLGYEYFIEFKKVFQVMSGNLSTVSQNDSVEQALQKMAGISASCLVVVENKHPVGIVTERDMARILIDGTNTAQLTVKDIMSHPVHTAHLSLPLLEVTRIMKEKRIRRIVVIEENGIIAGLVTQSDIIKGLHDQYLQNLKKVVVKKDRELEQTNRRLAEKTAYLDNILHSSMDMGMVAADLNYRIVYFNPAAEQILGLSATEAIGCDIKEIHQNRGIVAARFDQLVEMIKQRKRHEFSFVKGEGEKVRFITSMVNGIWDQEGNLVGFVLMLQDVTERTLAEKEIKQRKSDLELINIELSALYAVSSKINQILEMSELLSEVLDVVTKIETFNFERQGGVFGVYGDEMQLISQIGVLNSCFEIRKSIRIDDCMYGHAVKTGETVILGSTEIEKAGLEETKLHRAVIVPLKVKEKVIGVLCLFTSPDFSGMPEDKLNLLSAIGNQVGIAMENVRLYEQTRFLSLYDPLTNVANRRLMDMGLEKCLSAARRYGRSFSIIMLDIDNFKKYNDTHGHSAGDKMLSMVAQVLLNDIRDADAVARYGGEEFLIMRPKPHRK